MLKKPTLTRPAPPAPVTDSDDDVLLTDRELQQFLKVGSTHVFELQRDPSFPPPLVLSPRTKRHRLGAIRRWLATKQRTRTAEPA